MLDEKNPQVLIIMGSMSDWDTMKHCAETLEAFGIRYDRAVASAHRSPAKAMKLAEEAERRGVKIVVAAAGGAAHLAGVIAAHTPLPVLGVPMKGWALDGLDSLLSTVQMPRGIPVPTLSIGKAGAVNAAVASLQILALSDGVLRETLKMFRQNQTAEVEALQFKD